MFGHESSQQRQWHSIVSIRTMKALEQMRITGFRKSSSMFTSFHPARVLAVALAAGALLAPGSAYAEPKEPVDPGVRCAATTGPGDYHFYLPGERATDKDGKKWVCGPDGQWFRDYSALRVFHYSVNQVLASGTLAH